MREQTESIITEIRECETTTSASPEIETGLGQRPVLSMRNHAPLYSPSSCPLSPPPRVCRLSLYLPLPSLSSSRLLSSVSSSVVACLLSFCVDCILGVTSSEPPGAIDQSLSELFVKPTFGFRMIILLHYHVVEKPNLSIWIRVAGGSMLASAPVRHYFGW